MAASLCTPLYCFTLWINRHVLPFSSEVTLDLLRTDTLQGTGKSTPGSGIEPTSPALAGGFLPTVLYLFFNQKFFLLLSYMSTLSLLTEKAMAPYFSTLAWKIPWTEEPGGLQSMGSLRVGHDWATSLSLSTFLHWRRKWQPTPVFLPGESQGRGSLGGLPSMGSNRVGHDWSDLAAAASLLKLIF